MRSAYGNKFPSGVIASPKGARQSHPKDLDCFVAHTPRNDSPNGRKNQKIENISTISRPHPPSATKPVETISSDLAEFFPVWTQCYLEIRNLKDQMDELGWLMEGSEEISTTTSASVTRPTTRPMLSQLGIAEEFNRIIKNRIGISSRELLKDILGHHFALGWGGPLMNDQFGLVAVVSENGAVGKFLTMSKAHLDSQIINQSPNADSRPIRVYTLGDSNIRVSVIGENQLILATGIGMFGSMMDLASNTLSVPQTQTSKPSTKSAWDFRFKSLNSNPLFRSAISKAGAPCDFLFVLLWSGTDSLPGQKFNGTLLSQIQKNLRFFTISWFGKQSENNLRLCIQPRWVDPAFLPGKPLALDPILQQITEGRFDLVYACEIEPVRWYRRIVELANTGQPDAKQYRTLIDFVFPDPQLREGLIESLGNELLLVLDENHQKPSTAPNIQTQPAAQTKPATAALPLAATLLVRSNNPSFSFQAVDQMFNILGGFISLQNLAIGSSGPAGKISQETYNGIAIHTLVMGEFPMRTAGEVFPSIKRLELSWTVVEGYILISSSSDQLGKILDRMFAKKISANSPQNALPDQANWTMRFDPTKMSTHTKTLSNILGMYWPAIQSGLSDRRNSNFRMTLGIATRIIRTENSQPSVQVATVFPGYPAWEKLQVGDVILAVNNQPLTLDNPQKDLQKKTVSAINNKKTITFSVIRSGSVRDVTLSIPNHFSVGPVKSIKLLQRILSAVGKQFSEISMACRYATDGGITLDIEGKKK
jgi:hypothetical protein